jgi:folate-binding protein YgfZ
MLSGRRLDLLDPSPLDVEIADIAKQDQTLVTVAWSDDSTASFSDSTALADMRFRDVAVRRVYGGEAKEGGDPNAWLALRIGNGIAESSSDYQLGDAFPHDVLLDETGGVGFKKGCYIGQEVVSRMQHRGTARRRLVHVAADAPLPATGTTLTVKGRVIGALGTVVGSAGLAIVRIDKAGEAIAGGDTILAGDLPVTVALPAWTGLEFPSQADEASA